MHLHALLVVPAFVCRGVSLVVRFALVGSHGAVAAGWVFRWVCIL